MYYTNEVIITSHHMIKKLSRDFMLSRMGKRNNTTVLNQEYNIIFNGKLYMALPFWGKPAAIYSRTVVSTGVFICCVVFVIMAHLPLLSSVWDARAVLALFLSSSWAASLSPLHLPLLYTAPLQLFRKEIKTMEKCETTTEFSQ